MSKFTASDALKLAGILTRPWDRIHSVAGKGSLQSVSYPAVWSVDRQEGTEETEGEELWTGSFWNGKGKR
jgi:hypothetical protein